MNKLITVNTPSIIWHECTAYCREGVHATLMWGKEGLDACDFDAMVGKVFRLELIGNCTVERILPAPEAPSQAEYNRKYGFPVLPAMEQRGSVFLVLMRHERRVDVPL